MKKEVSNITYLYFFNNSPEIVTEMNLSFLFQHKGIVIGSNGNFLIFFLKNKEFQLTYKNLTKKLRNINYNVNGLVSYFLMSNAIKPSNQIVSIINGFTSLRFSSDYTVGLHLRTGYLPNKTEHHSIFNTFPHTEYIEKITSICSFLITHNKTCKVYIENRYNICYKFLVTDNPRLKQKLYENYSIIRIYDSTIGHSGGELLKRNSRVAIDAIVELYLLSKCDIIFGTPYSTYSSFANVLGGYSFV